MLRLATSEDAVAVHDIYAPIVRETHISFELEAPSVEEIARRIDAARAAELPWLVHETNARILGYAYANPHRARGAYRWTVESSVFVDPSTKRTGVGRGLYRALIDLLQLLGYRSVLAIVALPNTASVALHEKMGFTRVGIFRTAGYKLGKWHDVGWWALRIGETPGDPRSPLTIAEASARPEWAVALASATKPKGTTGHPYGPTPPRRR